MDGGAWLTVRVPHVVCLTRAEADVWIPSIAHLVEGHGWDFQPFKEGGLVQSQLADDFLQLLLRCELGHFWLGPKVHLWMLPLFLARNIHPVAPFPYVSNQLY
jgi:hypothetical protein